MWIGIGNGVVLLAVFTIVCAIRNSSANRKWKHQFAQFNDAVIVVVRGCTEQAEQRLFGIVARSDANRNGCYENVVLLLSTGEKPAKITAMLNLPLSQLKHARTAEAVAPGSQVGGAEKRDQEGYCTAQGLHVSLVLRGEEAVSKDFYTAKTAISDTGERPEQFQRYCWFLTTLRRTQGN